MGNLLGAPVTEKDTFAGDTQSQGAVRFAVSSMQGWRVHMEDAHIAEAQLYAKDKGTKLELPGHALFAVFDGHGGSYSALYAGRNLCRVLSRQTKFVQYAELFTKKGDKAEWSKLLEGALTDAFVDLDREIACALKGQKVAEADEPYHEGQAMSHGGAPENKLNAMTGVEISKDSASTESSSSGSDTAMQLLDDEGDSGTTACVILLSPDFIVCANAGDSRACLRQVNGRTLPLSFDHKPDDEGEEKRIRAAGGYVAGGRVEGDLAVSRGLGDFRFKQLDVVMKGVAGTASTVNGGDEGNPAASSTTVTRPGEQKVSPIPDIMVHTRDTQQDAFCIIACDGIWDVQTNEHATKLVADLFAEGESDMGLMCEEVCDICLRLGSKDNMTVLLMQFAAQQVNADGTGGVMVRRKARESENSAGQATSAGLST